MNCALSGSKTHSSETLVAKVLVYRIIPCASRWMPAELQTAVKHRPASDWSPHAGAGVAEDVCGVFMAFEIIDGALAGFSGFRLSLGCFRM